MFFGAQKIKRAFVSSKEKITESDDHESVHSWSSNKSFHAPSCTSANSVSCKSLESSSIDLELQNESQLLTFIKKMHQAMSEWTEARKTQKWPAHYNKTGQLAAWTKHQHSFENKKWTKAYHANSHPELASYFAKPAGRLNMEPKRVETIPGQSKEEEEPGGGGGGGGGGGSGEGGSRGGRA